MVCVEGVGWVPLCPVCGKGVVMIFRISQGVIRAATEDSPGRVLNFDYVYSFIQSSHRSMADIWSIVQSSSDQSTPDSSPHRIECASNSRHFVCKFRFVKRNLKRELMGFRKSTK